MLWCSSQPSEPGIRSASEAGRLLASALIDVLPSSLVSGYRLYVQEQTSHGRIELLPIHQRGELHWVELVGVGCWDRRHPGGTEVHKNICPISNMS